jgi:hypothetical protein
LTIFTLGVFVITAKNINVRKKINNAAKLIHGSEP